MIQLSKNVSDILDKSLEKFGPTEQIIAFIGECGEFTAEAVHYLQGRPWKSEEMLNEACDVMILNLQLRKMFGEENFDKAMAIKLEKLESKLKD